jgi:hypothetical protein
LKNSKSYQGKRILFNLTLWKTVNIIDYIIAKEQLMRLLKECKEVQVGSNEKIIPVLRRNIEIAICEKAKASLSYLELKKILNNDHSIIHIKAELQEILFNMECEDIPNEITADTKNDSNVCCIKGS